MNTSIQREEETLSEADLDASATGADEGAPQADHEDRPAQDEHSDTDARGAETGEQVETGETGEEVAVSESLPELLARLARSEEQVLRARAEAENIQRRSARDVENAHKFGVERLLKDLIPVLDSLDKAVEIARSGDSGASDAQGIELAARLLMDTVARHGVSRIEPQGEPFDPAWHEAVATAPNDACEENSVLDVVQAGFSLNGRLVRAAKVVVSRASA